MRTFKNILVKLYVLLLMAFTVWYGHFMYPLIFGFEGKEEAEKSLRELGDAGTEHEKLFVRLIAEQTERRKIDLGYRVIEQPFIEGRFHHIGFAMPEDKISLCVPCHGDVPHHSSKEIRSFLNMHVFYLACQTCHVPPEDGAPLWQFRWYDKDNGEVAPNPRALVEIEEDYRDGLTRGQYPIYGNYGAKIAPGREANGSFSFTHGVEDADFVKRYIDQQDRLGPKQQSQMERVIHRLVGDEPVKCRECHRDTDQYIPYAELGYPPRRIEELTYTAVVEMIEKYVEFYIPSFLTPGGAEREPGQELQMKRLPREPQPPAPPDKGDRP